MSEVETQRAPLARVLKERTCSWAVDSRSVLSLQQRYRREHLRSEPSRWPLGLCLRRPQTLAHHLRAQEGVVSSSSPRWPLSPSYRILNAHQRVHIPGRNLAGDKVAHDALEQRSHCERSGVQHATIGRTMPVGTLLCCKRIPVVRACESGGRHIGYGWMTC